MARGKMGGHRGEDAGSPLQVSEHDIYLFREGTHRRLQQKFGAHIEEDGGFRFTVWAPAARSVSVMGDFNGWNRDANPLAAVGESGVWSGIVADAEIGQRYKFRIDSRNTGVAGEKADPFAAASEEPPRTGSVLYVSDFVWGDQEWMETRGDRVRFDAPVSIYEMHLGSWRRRDTEAPLSYRELAEVLPDYLVRLGFTHVEMLPLTEHPFYGSWGYQTTGYFSPTSRYGDPDDLRFLINELHTRGIGVIMDWVPSHFPTDGHGLGYFDGTHLFEHADPRQGFHPDWKSFIFNYDRGEVRSFLISSAIHWIESFHVDSLRVDAVASMLYLDYSRKEGEWVPNRHGGRENIGAIVFLRELNEAIHEEFPGVATFAEESTSWPGVTRSIESGGLGFDYKWDMGWMHDTLKYMKKEPVHRRFHHNELTFRMVYAFSERFVLPLSHDEVVHGKGSLLMKMPGDRWQRFAGLRTLYSYMWTQPGKKLLFMGGELGQMTEWNHDASLGWPEDGSDGAALGAMIARLNEIYRERSPLHELDCSPNGFEWIDPQDAENSVVSWYRIDRSGNRVGVVLNLTPVPRSNYLIGAPGPGEWKVLFNSDETEWGGSGYPVREELITRPVASHGRYHSLLLDLPPLGALILAPVCEK